MIRTFTVLYRSTNLDESREVKLCPFERCLSPCELVVRQHMVFKYRNYAARYVLESRSCFVPRLHSLAAFRLLLLPQLTIDLLDISDEIADREILREEKKESISVGAPFFLGVFGWSTARMGKMLKASHETRSTFRNRLIARYATVMFTRSSGNNLRGGCGIRASTGFSRRKYSAPCTMDSSRKGAPKGPLKITEI